MHIAQLSIELVEHFSLLYSDKAVLWAIALLVHSVKFEVWQKKHFDIILFALLKTPEIITIQASHNPSVHVGGRICVCTMTISSFVVFLL